MRRTGQTWLRWLFALVAIIVLTVAASAIALRILRPTVSVTRAVEGPVVQAFYATGTLTPDREYPIRSNVAGIVVDVKVDKGQRVKRDEILAVVRNDELPLKLEQAKAELKEKQQRADDKTSPVLAEFDAKVSAFTALLELAVNEKTRQVALIEKGNGSQSDLDHSLEHVKAVWSDLESAKAQRATKQLELEKESSVAKAALDIAQWNYDQQTIRSPIDGVVLDRPVSLGTRLAINDHVMQVADVEPNQLVVRAQVDEEDRTLLQGGQKVIVTLYSFPGRPFTGVVHKIYPQADTDRRTFEVDVKLTDPDNNMAPGMTGELAFEVASKPLAMVVPAQAVQAGSVWIVRDQKLVKSAAQIGLKSVERAEIITGLSAGDQVLISPIGQMPEGQQVRTQFVDPRTAAALNKPVEKADAFKGFK
jgi:HlyD family secretion protein